MYAMMAMLTQILNVIVKDNPMEIRFILLRCAMSIMAQSVTKDALDDEQHVMNWIKTH